MVSDGFGATSTLYLSSDYADELDKAIIPYMANKTTNAVDIDELKSSFDNFTESDWKDFFAVKTENDTEQ